MGLIDKTILGEEQGRLERVWHTNIFTAAMHHQQIRVAKADEQKSDLRKTIAPIVTLFEFTYSRAVRSLTKRGSWKSNTRSMKRLSNLHEHIHGATGKHLLAWNL